MLSKWRYIKIVSILYWNDDLDGVVSCTRRVLEVLGSNAHRAIFVWGISVEEIKKMGCFLSGAFLWKKHRGDFDKKSIVLSLTTRPMPRWHASSVVLPYTNTISTVFARSSRVFAPLRCTPQVLALKGSFMPSSSTTDVIDSLWVSVELKTLF